jgi:DNA-binding CsgD family transcriptional regulator
MRRHVLIYGLIGGLLIAALKLSEYRFLVIEHSFEIYGGLVAATFSVLGIWLGVKINRPHPPTGPAAPAAATDAIATPPAENPPAPAAVPFAPDEKKREDLGITRRELEVLGLIAQGMSNREIAGKLFVSENTIKTHSSRVFDKLGAKRRTQAVQLGKELGLLP